MNRLALPLSALGSALAFAFAIACSSSAEDASSTPSPTSNEADGAPGSNTAPTAPTSVCSPGASPVHATLRNAPDGGTKAAVFADCFDAGGVPPRATEGKCTVLNGDSIDPLTMRPYIDPGTLRVTAPASGIDTTLNAANPAVDLPQAFVRPDTVTFASSLANEQLTAPLPSHGALVPPQASVARTADLEVSWTGTTGSSIVVRIVPEGAKASDPRVVCSAPAADGKVTVAAALLAHLPAGKALVAAESEARSVSARGAFFVSVRQELDGASSLTLQ